MKPTLIRRFRHRHTSSRSEGTIFKKETQESFFGSVEHQTFFQPVPAIQREPEKKEQEKLQRAEDKKEDEKVMKMEDKKEEETVQKKESGNSKSVGKSVSHYISSLNGKGQPLSHSNNYFFSARMGYDFSNVKVHTDKEAAASAKAVNAKAYTVENNIVFNDGQYNTTSTDGKRLLAHELTHVIQQDVSNSGTIQRWPGIIPPYLPQWKKDEIRHIQRGLRGRGLYVGETTGALDAQTKQGLDLWFGSGSWRGHAYSHVMTSLKFTGGRTKPGKSDCPNLNPKEIENSRKNQPQISERVPGKEWVISGFPIADSSLSQSDVDSFISTLSYGLFKTSGRFVYIGIMDKLMVKGFTDCVGDNAARKGIKSARARFISAAINGHVNDKSHMSETSISSDSEYLGPNTTEDDRTKNRSVVISKQQAKPVTYPGGYPYDPTYKPIKGNCVGYFLGDSYLGKTYPANAYDACTVSPDDPQNNCVRKCLQEKYFDFLMEFGPDLMSRTTIVPWCPSIWNHHVECYKVCGCENGFIDYLGFYPLCEYRSSPTISSIGINVFNRCNKVK